MINLWEKKNPECFKEVHSRVTKKSSWMLKYNSRNKNSIEILDDKVEESLSVKAKKVKLWKIK